MPKDTALSFPCWSELCLEIVNLDKLGDVRIMSEIKDFAGYLKESRQKAGLSQYEVSAKLGYSGPQFISNLERGISQLPIYKIPTFAELYNIPVQEFIDQVIAEHARVLRGKIDVALKSSG